MKMAEKEAKLEKLKLLLKLDVENYDLLEIALERSEEFILNYCNLCSIPAGLYYTHLSMAMDFYRGENYGEADGHSVKQLTEGDTSVTYSTAEADGASFAFLKSYEVALAPYRKMRW